MAEACLVFFRSRECDLNAAALSLAKCGLTVVRLGTELVVSWADSPEFRVCLDVGSHVPLEAAEIGAGTEFDAALRECNARFEVAFDDLGAALDEINTLMQIQGALQIASQGYLFLPWNGNILGPSK